ncbi:MAG TPA: TIGR04290 family methyltransferase [Chloroflexota bacterium]|nr:TIGR04290 family methyltransferase [Chloroflexota bacterium]
MVGGSSAGSAGRVHTSDEATTRTGVDQVGQVTARTLQEQVQSLGEWFHNVRLPILPGTHPEGSAVETIQTAPNHPLGDFPSNFWEFFKHAVPEHLTGKSVLDIGCNAGFYSFEMKRRGAARVLGIDHDARYLRQAEFARDCMGLDVEFRQVEVYDVDTLGETFDFVLFMGVFYHLRHPLYALEKVAKLVRGHLLFQTMERGESSTGEFEQDYPIGERDIFFDQRFPRMYFVEHSFAGDCTNWWVPNRAASEAMLRSVGMRIIDRPCHEVYLCEPAAREAH